MSQANKRVIYAPQPDSLSTPPAVISVELSNDEEVEWVWTFPNGQSVITSYKIFKKNNKANLP
jgi:hypothetical protein